MTNCSNFVYFPCLRRIFPTVFASFLFKGHAVLRVTKLVAMPDNGLIFGLISQVKGVLDNKHS